MERVRGMRFAFGESAAFCVRSQNRMQAFYLLAHLNFRTLLLRKKGSLPLPTQVEKPPDPLGQSFFNGAGEGNRTPINGLEGRGNSLYTTPANFEEL